MKNLINYQEVHTFTSIVRLKNKDIDSVLKEFMFGVNVYWNWSIMKAQMKGMEWLER